MGGGFGLRSLSNKYEDMIMTKKNEDTLTITVLRPTFLKGAPLEVGKNITLAKKEALDLIGASKAKLADAVTAEDKAQMKALEEQLKAGKKAKKEKHPSEIAFVPSVDTGRDVVPAAGKKVASSEDETKALADKKAADAKAKADAEAKLTRLANAELQEILEQAGVEYEPGAVKATLVELVISNSLV